MTAATATALLARNLASNTGWAVFPVLENKHPACPHGFKDAETTPDAIAGLWLRYPAPLIGIPTGVRSGVDVLDVDTKHHAARAWLTVAQDRIPPTRTFQTRSGGFHLLFHHAQGIHNTESHIAKGIDTRGEGGYFIYWFAAGYVCTDHSIITDWPDWLLEALFYTPKPTPVPVPAQKFRSNGDNVQNLVAATIRRLEHAPEGSRHTTLRAAACTLGGVLGASSLTSTTATRMLLDAVLQAGGARVDQRNALSTISWGLERGAASPLTVGVR